MSAYLSFIQVFFSKQFIEFVDIKDLPNYRRICKKAQSIRLDLFVLSSEYTYMQIKQKIPFDAIDDYEISPNTYLNRVEHEINRYYNMFDHIRVEDRLECRMRLEIYDSCKDISKIEEKELYTLGKKHYIYTHSNYDNCQHHIFAFTSQQELLDFIIDITDEIYDRNGYYNSEIDLFYYFLRIQESKYPGAKYKHIENEPCFECNTFFSNI
jgi:hypothetical protein